jgi:hypothetical protein
VNPPSKHPPRSRGSIGIPPPHLTIAQENELRGLALCPGGQQPYLRNAQQPAPGGASGTGRTSYAANYREFKRHIRGPGALPAALECESGQACMFFFGMQLTIFGIIHVGQLLGEERFVNAPDGPLPHASRTLRWVRVLDVLVSFIFGVLVVRLALELRRKTISGSAARKVLVQALFRASAAYLVGALVDVVQCHYQGDGTGSHCHGYNCLRLSVVLGVSAVVGEYQQHFFCGLCFGGLGIYRISWVLREERGLLVSVAVLLVSTPLLVFLAVLYVEDMVAWDNYRRSKREQATETRRLTSKESDSSLSA